MVHMFVDLFVLETVTLGLQVKLMGHMFVDLFGFSVFTKKTTKNSHSPHPQHLLRHTSIGSTLSFTSSGVSSLPARNVVLSYTSTGVDSNRFADDQTVLDQLAHVLPGVSVGDHGGLVRIQPDLVFAAFHDGGGEPL